MKLQELTEMPEEGNSNSNWNISPRDMQVVFDALRNSGELDKSDVSPMAAELVDDFEGYSKNAGSARFLINRMHTIMFGMAPSGVTEHSAEQFMTPARPLIAFMSEKGYNPEEAINMARDEARTRLTQQKREPSVKAVMDFYKQNKATFTPIQDRIIRSAREQLIQQVMSGVAVDAAYSQLLSQQ